jgi:molybdopterin molybdotransferase
MFGRLAEMPVLGLPGNPVSAFVCALLFARPLLRAMQGLPADDAPVPGRLAAPLAANDRRQDYLRSSLERRDDGELWVTPFGVQDSAMISRFAAADALLVRPPHAPAATPGDRVDIIPLYNL